MTKLPATGRLIIFDRIEFFDLLIIEKVYSGDLRRAARDNACDLTASLSSLGIRVERCRCRTEAQHQRRDE